MNKTGLKIVTIGGGSSYTPELVEGFIKRYKELPIKELWLVDIEEGKEKLEIVGNLARRMVAKAGLNFTIHLTLNRKEALKDADFVTTQFRVGLLEARIADERLALSLGMLGQETNGLAGFGKALRTIPVMLDICTDMAELCPNAYLINFTNPSGMVTEAVLRYTKIKCIGLCNGPIGMAKAVEEAIGHNNFMFIAQGLNHYLFGRHIYYNGLDVLPQLLPKLLENEKHNAKNVDLTPWATEAILAGGLMPCSYHRYYYMLDDMLKKQLDAYKKNETRAEQVKKVEEKLFLQYKNPSLNIKPPELAERGGAYYSDAACNLISGIYNNSRSLMVVNVLNQGTIEALPHNAVIETTSVITNSGALPIKAQPLPEWAQAELMLLKTFERLTIQATTTGHYGVALQALTLNPLVPKGAIIKTALDKLLQQNKPWLPAYWASVFDKVS